MFKIPKLPILKLLYPEPFLTYNLKILKYKTPDIYVMLHILYIYACLKTF